MLTRCFNQFFLQQSMQKAENFSITRSSAAECRVQFIFGAWKGSSLLWSRISPQANVEQQTGCSHFVSQALYELHNAWAHDELLNMNWSRSSFLGDKEEERSMYQILLLFKFFFKLQILKFNFCIVPPLQIMTPKTFLSLANQSPGSSFAAVKCPDQRLQKVVQRDQFAERRCAGRSRQREYNFSPISIT